MLVYSLGSAVGGGSVTGATVVTSSFSVETNVAMIRIKFQICSGIKRGRGLSGSFIHRDSRS